MGAKGFEMCQCKVGLTKPRTWTPVLVGPGDLWGPLGEGVGGAFRQLSVWLNASRVFAPTGVLQGSGRGEMCQDCVVLNASRMFAPAGGLKGGTCVRAVCFSLHLAQVHLQGSGQEKICQDSVCMNAWCFCALQGSGAV